MKPEEKLKLQKFIKDYKPKRQQWRKDTQHIPCTKSKTSER